MGGKEAVTFRFVRAENLFGFNGKDCDPLRRSELGARVMPRQKNGDGTDVQSEGDHGGQARGRPGTAPWSCRVLYSQDHDKFQ